VVGEPLCGFIAHAAPWLKKSKRYVAWKRMVRALANSAGVPDDIPADQAAVLSIAIAWKKRARIDTSNIIKSMEDALFKQDRGIEIVVCERFEHIGREEASVMVSFRMRGKGERKNAKGILPRGVQ
jgi:hypothetical protein